MKKDVDNKLDIYKITTSKELLKYYKGWTEKNKYNQDMIDLKYVAPKETTLVLKKYALNNKCRILDAGCGTGLVGIELKKSGYSNIDGVDFSQNMLDLLPKGIYKNIEKVDLNKPLNFKANTYDVVTCVGTFTYGHVKAHALNEFVRVTNKNSYICFTINEGIYSEYKFDKKINELSKNKSWEVLNLSKTSYIVNKDVDAWLCLAKKN